MKEYLNPNDYVPIGEDLTLGEQVHINHENCPAGEDTKQRLYIKRGDEDGRDCILAYCHNCGLSGFKPVSTKAGEYSRILSSKVSRDADGPYTGRRESNWDRWDGKAISFCTQGKVTDGLCKRYGIEYCSDDDAVYIPILKDGREIGYQLRNLSLGHCPKYETTAFEKPLFWYSGNTNNTLVIVEDVLSAIRCAEYVSSLALLSSNMSDDIFEFIASTEHTDFIVFLDDDNRAVKKSQSKIAQKLSALGTVRVIHSNGKDPKEFNNEELERILCHS